MGIGIIQGFLFIGAYLSFPSLARPAGAAPVCLSLSLSASSIDGFSAIKNKLYVDFILFKEREWGK